MEDFKYEFDLSVKFDDFNYNVSDILLDGYIYLHQFVKQDLCKSLDDNRILLDLIEDSLEDGESVTEENNIFTLKLNKITDEIINYVKMIIKYSLTDVSDFNVENNIITWRKHNEDKDNGK